MEEKLLRYESPTVSVCRIEIEHGIAAGSANVDPRGETEVQHQWEEDVVDERDVNFW